jgi:mannose-6-phosphate isomerase-like protein (cupin superfamily)
VYDISDLLTTLAAGFVEKISSEFAIAVQFDIKESDTPWHLVVKRGRQVSVCKGPCRQADFRFQTDLGTLRAIVDGKMTGLTASSKASASDSAPLEVRLADGLEFDCQTRVRLSAFIQHFFNPSNPERNILKEEHSRVVHGGHAIPLYYYPGFRSAWYMLRRGESLNNPGDTNPFPQAFILVEGRGLATIGDKTVDVAAGQSYYIPPDSDHVVKNESDDPLTLIWLAWGEGA